LSSTARRLGLALLAASLASSAVSAHELGTIRTYATFEKGGTYRVEVIIDREHLPPGFSAEAAPAKTRIRGLSPEVASENAGKVLSHVFNHSRILFDGKDMHFDAEWSNPDPASAELVLALRGEIPGGAKTFTWVNSLKLGSYLLTISTEGESGRSRQWVEGEPSRPFLLKAEIVPPTRGQVAFQYLGLGFTHILPKGTDHILFVLGVFLLSIRLKPVLLQVTAFTVAHTITLALTIYGVVSLPSRIVEPLIAVSIVYVAVENVVHPKLSPWRVALVFGFGLLHGMGFAGVLSQLGLPRSEFLTALLCFNAGVELGQLSVILAAFLLIGLPFRRKPWYRSRVVIPASLAIAAVGLYWAIQRLGAL